MSGVYGVCFAQVDIIDGWVVTLKGHLLVIDISFIDQRIDCWIIHSSSVCDIQCFVQCLLSRKKEIELLPFAEPEVPLCFYLGGRYCRSGLGVASF